MIRVVLCSFLFVAILGLGCIGVAVPGNAYGHCEDPNDPLYDAGDCEGISFGDFQKGFDHGVISTHDSPSPIFFDKILI